MKAKINIGDKVRLNDEYGTTAIVERITGDCLTVKCQNGYNFWSAHSVAVVQTKEDIKLNNDKEMKLKDLLKGRDKLRKYDELKEWKEYFGKDELYLNSACALFGKDEKLVVFIPDRIKQIILDALDAEIKKMEEE